jgi:hypothetical protein
MDEYKTEVKKTAQWEMKLGDCIETIKDIQEGTIDYSIFSPPFASLYTYSSSERDLGNCQSDEEFFLHFSYIIKELLRITKPGRLVAVHCMNLPTKKVIHGYIGLLDFRGDIIRAFQKEEFIYHSEVCIQKNPQAAAIRTHAKGLMFKQLHKDSSDSRQGLPDYICVFKKPGENEVQVKSDIDNDYIGHLRYLKKYNLKESVESEDHYKDLADKLFYDVNEYFVEERGRFLPIKVMLSRNSSGNYSGSLCLGPGWAGRMDDDEEDWLFDLVGSYQKEHNIYFGICANSFDSKTFYERTNNAWGDGHDFNNLPDYPFPERLE